MQWNDLPLPQRHELYDITLSPEEQAQHLLDQWRLKALIEAAMRHTEDPVMLWHLRQIRAAQLRLYLGGCDGAILLARHARDGGR